MANCKDCIHFDVCKNLYETHGDGLSGDSHTCDYFKNYSRFVELLCKPDDLLFLLVDRYGRIGRKTIKVKIIKEVYVERINICSGDWFITFVDCVTQTIYDYIKPKDFGKCIFLTREEAERVLQEGQKND